MASEYIKDISVKILALITEQQGLRRSQISEPLNLNVRTCLNALKYLVHNKKAVRVPVGKNVYYWFAYDYKYIELRLISLGIKPVADNVIVSDGSRESIRSRQRIDERDGPNGDEIVEWVYMTNMFNDLTRSCRA